MLMPTHQRSGVGFTRPVGLLRSCTPSHNGVRSSPEASLGPRAKSEGPSCLASRKRCVTDATSKARMVVPDPPRWDVGVKHVKTNDGPA